MQGTSILHIPICNIFQFYIPIVFNVVFNIPIVHIPIFPLLNKGEKAVGVWNGKEKSGGNGAFPSGHHCAGWSSGVPAGMAVPVTRYETKGMGGGFHHLSLSGSWLPFK